MFRVLFHECLRCQNESVLEECVFCSSGERKREKEREREKETTKEALRRLIIVVYYKNTH